jgi:hypothetical protein
VQHTVCTHNASKDKARTSAGSAGDSSGLNSEAGSVHVAVPSPTIEVRNFSCVASASALVYGVLRRGVLSVPKALTLMSRGVLMAYKLPH